ncbi:hypothetical protein I79_015401 [Cricetulus griseus]|uniref:Uncharacterized protein n=1 Tax=Cricetulus griseus TaxID=10029 RepID=G3HWP0_CRIGR|nr:hypothetical protein I79_015401 [Cricetulus griseus]
MPKLKLCLALEKRMCLYSAAVEMGRSPGYRGLLAVAGPPTYCGALGQPAVFSYCQCPHL